MSGSVNKAIIVGNLGQDPEVRRTRDGRPIVNMSVATSDTWRDKATGERKEKTEWHRIVVFQENAAKFCEQYLKKGAKVYVEGSIYTRKWTDKNNVEKYSTEIVVQNFNHSVQSLDRSEGGGNRPPPADSPDDYGRATTRQSGGSNSQAGRRDDMDDEIPF